MHPISEGTASSWSAGGSVDFTAPPSLGGVAAGENGNKTKQSWGWKNEKADFFFFSGMGIQENCLGIVATGS